MVKLIATVLGGVLICSGTYWLNCTPAIVQGVAAVALGGIVMLTPRLG